MYNLSVQLGGSTPDMYKMSLRSQGAQTCLAIGISPALDGADFRAIYDIRDYVYSYRNRVCCMGQVIYV